MFHTLEFIVYYPFRAQKKELYKTRPDLNLTEPLLEEEEEEDTSSTTSSINEHNWRRSSEDEKRDSSDSTSSRESSEDLGIMDSLLVGLLGKDIHEVYSLSIHLLFYLIL